MEALKSIALSIWTNHRKKVIAFVFGLLFAAVAAILGVPVAEIKDAAHEASAPSAVTVPLVVPPIPAPVKPNVK